MASPRGMYVDLKELHHMLKRDPPENFRSTLNRTKKVTYLQLSFSRAGCNRQLSCSDIESIVVLQDVSC